jgi:hypothetical protein
MFESRVKEAKKIIDELYFEGFRKEAKVLRAFIGEAEAKHSRLEHLESKESKRQGEFWE